MWEGCFVCVVSLMLMMVMVEMLLEMDHIQRWEAGYSLGHRAASRVPNRLASSVLAAL